MPTSGLLFLHSCSQEEASTKATVWGGEKKNRFSSFITACCQAGFQLNFSCALTRALLFPEISHHLKHSLLSFAPGLCAVLSDTPPSSKRLFSPFTTSQGPQLHTVVTRSFKLPNPSHLCAKLVLASILFKLCILHI